MDNGRPIHRNLEVRLQRATHVADRWAKGHLSAPSRAYVAENPKEDQAAGVADDQDEREEGEPGDTAPDENDNQDKKSADHDPDAEKDVASSHPTEEAHSLR